MKMKELTKYVVAGIVLAICFGFPICYGLPGDDTSDTAWKIQRLVQSYELVCRYVTGKTIDMSYQIDANKFVLTECNICNDDISEVEADFLRYAITTAAGHRMTAVPIEPTITDTTTFRGLFENWYCKIVDFPGGYKDSLMVIFNINGCIDTVRSSTKRGLIDKATLFVREHTVYIEPAGGDSND